MLADRVRMGSGKDSFDGVLYADGIGGDLWTNTVNPSYNYHNVILQTTPFLEIGPHASWGNYHSSPISTKKKYDLSKFNSIIVEYELLSDERTEGVKQAVMDISNIENIYPGELYILISIGYNMGAIQLLVTVSYTQNEFLDPYYNEFNLTGWTGSGWQMDTNRRGRIHKLILE